jgi:DNA-binding response OmpR family regulator
MRKYKRPPVGELPRAPVQCQPVPRRRILVVDEDPYICHLSAEVLIRYGYEVNAAEDGATAWGELQANNYNLLVTEFDLPKITGVELVWKLRAARMALPVVVVTEKAPAPDLVQTPSLQVAAILLKPIAVNTFLDAVINILPVAASPREEIALPNWHIQPLAVRLRG